LFVITEFDCISSNFQAIFLKTNPLAKETFIGGMAMSAIAKLKTTFAKEGKKQQQQEENVYGSLD
jgi:hypothetical protein